MPVVSQAEGWAELERMNAVKIAIAPAPAARGGEWDWYTALANRERLRIRRWFMAEGEILPDVLAGHLGYGTDVDGAMAQWLAAVRMTEGSSYEGFRKWACYRGRPLQVGRGVSLEDAYGPVDRGELVRTDELVGVAEIAAELDVPVNTVHVWRRRTLPAPLCVVSGTALWRWSEILVWATETGRKDPCSDDAAQVEF